MSENGPTPPEDPAWVDDIVRRALERVDDDPVAPPVVVAAADAPSEPAHAPAPPTRTPEPTIRVADTPPTADATAERPILASPPPDPGPATDEPAMLQASPSATEATPIVTDVTPRPVPEAADAHPAPGPYPDATGEHPVDAPAHAAGDGDDADAMSHRMRGFLEWGAVVVGALAVALLIKTFLMQAYFIPSSSMESTLNIGDRVLVNKLSYEFGDVGRGDLVVFNRPPTQADGEDDLIKRVIALGGETIEIVDGEVFITPVGADRPSRLEEPYLEGINTTGFVDTSGCVTATPTSCEIPDGHLFVMGDNRGGSKDSRFFGPIDDELVVGRAFLRVWPLGDISFL